MAKPRHHLHPTPTHPAPPYVYDWAAPLGVNELPIAPPGTNVPRPPSTSPHPLAQPEIQSVGLLRSTPPAWNFENGLPRSGTHTDSVSSQSSIRYARREFDLAITKLIWDLRMLLQATMWDRTFGSTTMILHGSGTTVPGTPPAPEYLPTMPSRHCAMAQIFIEHIGIPTVATWTADVRQEGWFLTQPAGPIHRNFFGTDLLVPQPQTAGSSHYIFRERTAGFTLLATPTSIDTPPSPISTHYSSEEPLSAEGGSIGRQATTRDHLSAMQQLTETEREVRELSLELAASADREANYTEEHGQLRARITELEQRAQGANIRGQFSPHPPTYAVSQMASTRPRTIMSSPSPTKSFASPTNFSETINWTPTLDYFSTYSMPPSIDNIILHNLQQYIGKDVSSRREDKWRQSFRGVTHFYSVNEYFHVKVTFAVEILAIIEHGGTGMVNHQEVTNPYNTFKSEKVAECRERGDTKNTPQIHHEYYAEYCELADEEKEELVERFLANRSHDTKLRCATPMQNPRCSEHCTVTQMARVKPHRLKTINHVKPFKLFG
ncbi:hypothetical protein B0H14DRAFT_2594942 [Mycena olivaceomarginata]|nr:hypothetical protein B0H14DRAFT_2594942 [Mycena olivaceomarginata]